MSDNLIKLELTRERAEGLREAVRFAISHEDFAASRLTREVTMAADELRAALTEGDQG